MMFHELGHRDLLNRQKRLYENLEKINLKMFLKLFFFISQNEILGQ